MSQKVQGIIPDCSTCHAHARSVFVELRTSELHSISETKGCRQYVRNEAIFHADATPSGLYCIHQGQVKVIRTDSEGREQIIRISGDGDILGYRSLIGGGVYECDAIALGPTKVCHIPKSVFFSLLANSTNLSTNVLTLLAQELRLAEDRLVEMAQKSIPERLAETLLMLRETYGVERDESTLKITLTQIELANFIGTAPESISRALSKFRKDGLIRVRGRKISLVNIRALTTTANLQD